MNHFYPDGTYRKIAPTDGQSVFGADPMGGFISWKYDGFKGEWYSQLGGTYISYSDFTQAHLAQSPGSKITWPTPLSGFYVDEQIEMPLHEPVAKVVVCECGSEKVNSPRHSRWCGKYHPEQ